LFFKIWHEILPAKELLKLGSCQSQRQGSALNWIKAVNYWNLTDIQAFPIDVKSFCASEEHFAEPALKSDQLVVFPERRIREMSELVCHLHGGELPVPENEEENMAVANLAKKYRDVCMQEGKQNLAQPYIWLGIQDDEGKGTWRKMEDNSKVIK